MTFIIGTDKLIDFSDMNPLDNDNYVKNLKTIINYNYYYRIKFLKKYEEVFFGNIYDVNAYYNPTMNFMIFPYGILRPPYFYNTDMKNLDNINIIAYNFGALGSVIGHEMIHGFDDQGRKFDKNGVLDLKSTWWEKESEERYNKLTDIIIEKYKRYRVNPKLTLGENIADIGGLYITYNALINLINENYDNYKKPKKENKNELILRTNFNFIKAWTMIWRSKITPQEYENQILNDVHSPNNIRVNVPLNFLFKRIDKENNIYIEKEENIDEQIW
jgi:putative endopeptidase